MNFNSSEGLVTHWAHFPPHENPRTAEETPSLSPVMDFVVFNLTPFGRSFILCSSQLFFCFLNGPIGCRRMQGNGYGQYQEGVIVFTDQFSLSFYSQTRPQDVRGGLASLGPTFITLLASHIITSHLDKPHLLNHTRLGQLSIWRHPPM